MDWQHAPLHRTKSPGWYFVTAGTYLKQPYLADGSRRDSLLALMQEVAPKHGLELQDWAILSNHYHVMLIAEPGADLATFIRKVHSKHAHELNALDRVRGRKVWFQYWEKHLSDRRSYLARLNYIHQNAVHHGVVACAENYRWSSVRVFQERVERAFAESVRKFRTDRLRVPDDF